MQILVDTGATNTFVNYNTLRSLNPNLSLNKSSSSFVLADGIAPFQVLGTVALQILFDDQLTFITAYVAQNLCTDVIIGMDYIAFYNLKFNVRSQRISIELHGRQHQVPTNPNVETTFIPVFLHDDTYIPPHSSSLANVSITIPSLSSIFIPHYQFLLSNTATIPHKFLQFYDHRSHLTFYNTSSRTHFVPRGTQLGYLCHHSPLRSDPFHNSSSHVSCDAINPFGAVPDSHVYDIATLRNNRLSSPFSCASDNALSSSLKSSLHQLVSHISVPEQRDALLNLLGDFHSIFDTSKHNIANTSIHHVINTVPHAPPASRPYTQPDTVEILYNMVQEFLAANLVAESHSPYAAPAFLVKKHDGTYRFVVDYKRLNTITIKDSSPLPNMEATIMKLGAGYKYFSKLDLKSGFYQIPIREEDKEKTAFITPFGLFQFNVLPMGLKNSPPTFQKVMSNTLQFCRHFALVYLDDIVVFSKTYEDHMFHLAQVFSAIHDRNFVLNPPKCELLVSQIDYLGHTVSATTITPLKERIHVILDMKEPRLLSHANKFLGALSWYRKFIPHFATIAAPIHAVTNLTRKNRHKFHWRFAQSRAFQQLKQLLVSAPLFLHYPVPDVPLILTTDASNIGIGGVLQQEVNGELHNLYYHSQMLTRTEQKYSTIEKEALAIYKCFARMRPFLLGQQIIVMTDHCPLCHIMTKTVNNARVDRITTLIQEYNIEKVVHINGRHNCLPDYLSRYPREQTDDLFDVEYGLSSHTTPPPSTSTNIVAAMTLRPRLKGKAISYSPPSTIDDNTLSSHHSPHQHTQDLLHTSHVNSPFSTNTFDVVHLHTEQQRDPYIQQQLTQLCSNSNPTSFLLKDNLLYRSICLSRRSKTKQEVLCLPQSMILSLLQACHDDPMSGGHFSLDRTYQKLKLHYWWPNMTESIKQYIRSCALCQQYNVSRQKKPGRLRCVPPPDGPFQTIGIDYCGPLPRTPRDNRYVLVITDYFSRHVVAIPLPNCSATTTAEALFNDYFCKFGIPCLIVSDQGPHFRNQLMTNMRSLIGYNHIYSTAYHPQSNGIVERFNSTFIPQISKLQDGEHNNWDEYLQAVVFAYNSGVHKTTQYSPYELLYGRPPRLPFHPPPTHFSFPPPCDYLVQLHKTLTIYHKSARSYIVQQQGRNKARYDTNRSDPYYKVGDRVITRVHGMNHKLGPLFSPSPKIIVKTLHPTYVVCDEQTHSEFRVHVNDLRPLCHF